MDKVIRIVSFQNAFNYGAVLQAYGLQQTLRKFGFKDVRFINYKPNYLMNRYKIFHIDYIKEIKQRFPSLKPILNLPFKWLAVFMRNKQFEKSIRELLAQTKVVYTDYTRVNEECDVLICGSDQIWNKEITGEYDKMFFGYGNYSGLKKIISYAPSTEVSSYNDKSISEIAVLLLRFDKISVRESHFRHFLTKYTNLHINICIDPTLLCGRDEYDRIASKRLIKNRYILVYAYDPYSKFIQDIILTIPNSSEYEIHYIYFGAAGIGTFLNRYIHDICSVNDFISLFKYASYTIVNSFHGLAFSLMFMKNFYVPYEDGKFERCLSLLETVGLTNRMIKRASDAEWEDIDYIGVNILIDKQRKSSEDFLLNTLNNI